MRYHSDRESFQVNILINDKAVRWIALLFSLCNQMLNLCFMKLGDLLVESFDDVFADLIGTERDAKLILCAINYVDECLLNRIINTIHTEIQMLDLRVLDGHPLLNLLSSFIYSFD